MLDDPDLERLLTDVESDRVERKSSLSDTDRISQAICAFANDLPAHRQPGYLFIGVDDAGRATGLPVTDALLRSLADMRSSGNILPVPAMAVQRRTLRGAPVAVVEVQPSVAPPVRYKGQVWVRVGPRRAVATIEEERRLAERHVAGVLTFDQRGATAATLDDLLLDTFRADYLPRVVDPAVLAENRRSEAAQLASLRFFDLRTQTPTNAGVLLFGRDPLQHLPGAWVQFARFAGDSLVDPIQDQKTVAGSLMTQLVQLESLLPIQIHTARVPATDLQHREEPDYPLQAIRELTFNALMHRTYEGTSAPVRLNWFTDRLEVQSPGGLYGQVTPENYRQMTDYRNPVVAGAMKALGYVERFGTGIARTNAALARNGNPAAEFRFEPTYVLVTIRSRS